MKSADPALYEIVLEYPWLSDEIGPGSLPRLGLQGQLYAIAHEYPTVAAAVPRFAWLSVQDLPVGAGSDLNLVISFRREMPELAPRVLELRWLFDRVTLRKAQVLSDIFVMAKTDPELSGRILSIEFEDEVTSELRSFAIHSVDYLCLAEYESLNWCDEILAEAWLQDGLTKEKAAKVVALNTSLSTELFFELAREGTSCSNPKRSPHWAMSRYSWSVRPRSKRMTG